MSTNRNFIRLKTDLKVVISTNDEKYEANIIDISLKGLLVEEHTHKLDIGNGYTLEIKLAGSDLIMSFESKCVHHEDGHYGFVFTSESVDSITHLRRFLELNSADATEITRELQFLIDK